MSDRYSRLFALPENLYAAGSPVLIAAGALLKDNNTGKVLAQLKIQNIGGKRIKAATVRISPLDTVGKPLGDSVEHQYLDLTADRDADFGAKEPVALPDAATRAFSVVVVEVAFSDNSVWAASNEPWETIPAQARLSDVLHDPDLQKQYRLEYGEGCHYTVDETKDLWRCACGAFNRRGESACHICGKNLLTLKSVDMGALAADRDARLQQEKAEREEAERKAEAKAKRNKKIAAIVIPVVAVCIAFAIVITQVIIPWNQYKAAESLLASGQYQEAKKAFAALGDYKDSADRVQEIAVEIRNVHQYESAVALLDDGQYDEAKAAFEALGDYKDSKARIADVEEAKNAAAYADAEELLGAGEYEEAKSAFMELGNYKDSMQKIEECDELINEDSYQNALSLRNEGQYYDAYAALIELGDYKDCALLAETIQSEHPKLFATKGDTITFGSYEQDNNFENGLEPIEWIVVEHKDNEILVVSKYVLDCEPFNSVAEATTWRTCSLRTWLNNTFADSAFNDKEKQAIITSTVTAEKNPYYNTNAGQDSQDNLFLLSVSEAQKYFTTNYTSDPSGLMCYATDYAISRGVEAQNDKHSPWSLRTPRANQASITAIARNSGAILGLGNTSTGQMGLLVEASGQGVRPAMWIDANGL